MHVKATLQPLCAPTSDQSGRADRPGRRETAGTMLTRDQWKHTLGQLPTEMELTNALWPRHSSLVYVHLV